MGRKLAKMKVEWKGNYWVQLLSVWRAACFISILNSATSIHGNEMLPHALPYWRRYNQCPSGSIIFQECWVYYTLCVVIHHWKGSNTPWIWCLLQFQGSQMIGLVSKSYHFLDLFNFNYFACFSIQK